VAPVAGDSLFASSTPPTGSSAPAINNTLNYGFFQDAGSSGTREA